MLKRKLLYCKIKHAKHKHFLFQFTKIVDIFHFATIAIVAVGTPSTNRQANDTLLVVSFQQTTKYTFRFDFKLKIYDVEWLYRIYKMYMNNFHFQN